LKNSHLSIIRKSNNKKNETELPITENSIKISKTKHIVKENITNKI